MIRYSLTKTRQITKGKDGDWAKMGKEERMAKIAGYGGVKPKTSLKLAQSKKLSDSFPEITFLRRLLLIAFI